jgi:hypothetical protein
MITEATCFAANHNTRESGQYRQCIGRGEHTGARALVVHGLMTTDQSAHVPGLHMRPSSVFIAVSAMEPSLGTGDYWWCSDFLGV